MSYSGTTFTKKSEGLGCLLGCYLAILALAVALIVGHISNIIQVVIWACGDAPQFTVYTVTKIVAVFVPVLGSVMGYVGFFK
jgi:hypothetical protein